MAKKFKNKLKEKRRAINFMYKQIDRKVKKSNESIN